MRVGQDKEVDATIMNAKVTGAWGATTGSAWWSVQVSVESVTTSRRMNKMQSGKGEIQECSDWSYR